MSLDSVIDLALEGIDELIIREHIYCNPFIIEQYKRGKNIVLAQILSSIREYAGEYVVKHNFPAYDIQDAYIAKKCLLELKYDEFLSYNGDFAKRVDKGKDICYAYVKMHIESDRYKKIPRDVFLKRFFKN